MACRYAGICDACSVQFQASRDMTAAWEDVLECIRTAEGMARISAEYVKSLTFNKERMENILNNGFSNATEIADSLVLQGGLSFRQAHKVVGAAVSRLFEQKLGQEALTWELLDEYCRSINGVPLPITPEQVAPGEGFPRLRRAQELPRAARRAIRCRECLNSSMRRETPPLKPLQNTGKNGKMRRRNCTPPRIYKNQRRNIDEIGT